MNTYKKIAYQPLLLFITTFLFFSLISDLQAQWSTDPNSNLVIGVGWDPHIVSDSAGGCYVTYNYESFYPQKLAVERIDRYGYKPWENKIQILGELPEQWQAEIVEDGEGGVIVSYQDNEVIGTNYITRVRVQRIDSSGNFLWGQTGVRVTTNEINHGGQQLVGDGEGGCIILWQNYNDQISINRINIQGQRVWGDVGVLIDSAGYSLRIIRANDGSYYVQINTNLYRISQNGEIVRKDSVTLGYIVPDLEGGIVLSGRVWTGMIPKLVAQRKDSLGNNLWQEPYVIVADSLDINTQLKIYFNSGYYYYSWFGRKNSIDLVTQIQALRQDGSKLYNQGSLPISNYPVDALLGGILPSESGTVVLLWEDFRPEDGVFGQRLDTLGNRLWDTIDVSLYTGMYADLFSTTDGNGGAIGLGWHQFDFSLRMFKVSKNGVMGEVITNMENRDNTEYLPLEYFLFQNYPNPFNSSTTIKYQLPEERRIRINLYNMLGENILTLYEGERKAGTYRVILSSDELSSGVYFYVLETNSSREVKKLTIIK